MISRSRIKNAVSLSSFQIIVDKEKFAGEVVGCFFILALLLSLALFGNSAMAQPISTGPVTGSAIAMTSLSNYPIGQNLDRRISIRFKSDHSGKLASFRVYWVYKSSKGYHAGDGGDIRITLKADDGSASHLPSSSVLAATTFSPRLPLYNPTSVNVHFKDLSFANYPTLVKGTTYHLEFVNVDPNKSGNWISINSVYNASRSSSTLQPTESTAEWALLSKVGYGGWQYTPGYCPILALGISRTGGRTPDVYQGNGYMEFWGASTNGARAGGSLMLRQGFKATQSLRVGGASVSAGRYGGTGSLKVELLSSTGVVLDTGFISSGSFPYALSSSGCPARMSGEKCHVWGYAKFNKAPSISLGQTYFLRVSAASGSDYRFNLPRDGSIMYGWPAGTVVSGRTEKSTSSGRSWTGISYWGQTNRNDADMEFFLEAL